MTTPIDSARGKPGTRLRALAAQVCSAATMERLIDPVVADLQMEHGEAARARHVWKSRRVLLVGYLAFAKVFALAGIRGTRLAWHNWSREDQLALVRVLWLSVVGIPAVSLILYLLALTRLLDMRSMNPQSSVTLLTAFLIPSILTLGLPAGLGLSIAAMSGQAMSRRVRAAVILIAIVGSLTSLVNVAWVTPLANQAYREEMLGRPVARGERELTLTELSSSRTGLFLLHARLALATAPLTFAVFGLIAATRRRFRRIAALGVATAGVVSYVVLVIVGDRLSFIGLVRPIFGAWAPELLLVAATALLVIVGDPKRTLAHANTRVS